MVVPFPSARGPISELTLWAEVKEAAARAGLRRVSPHRLRHTFATEYLRRGGNIRRLQQILGHESLASTQIYTQVMTEELREDVERLDFGA